MARQQLITLAVAMVVVLLASAAESGEPAAAPGTAGAAAPAPGVPVTRNAKDFYTEDSATCGIQEAINSLPKEGGRVLLEARTYVLRASIVLRENVTLSGHGRDTILKRRAEVIHKLTENATQGASTVTVAATDSLRVGDEIAIRDDKFNGWYCTHGIIKEIKGNVITIDDRLVQPYKLEQKAIVINHHPMVSVFRIWDYRYHTSGFVVEDITIDGNLAENPTPISDWSTAAIHLASTGYGTIQRVVVRNFITDGISDQYGLFNVIRDCLVENCRGNGFHPGTSVRGSRFINNIARNNEGDGLFFCADVTGIQVTNNTFANNKKNGIGGIGAGGDSFNVVSGNVCFGNGRNGIQTDAGGCNTITANVCFDNSTAEPGKFAGIGLENTTDVIVTGNICGSKVAKGKPLTQGYGIVETGTCDRNVITGNIVRDNSVGAVVTVGAASVSTGNVSAPPVELPK